LPFSTYTRSINRWIKRDAEVVLIPFYPHKAKLKYSAQRVTKYGGTKLNTHRKYKKAALLQCACAQKFSKTLFFGFWTFGQSPPPTCTRCMLYVLLLITTDGPGLFASTSLCHINFCQCLYYQIPDINILQGIMGHVLLSSQLHYEYYIQWFNQCTCLY
jgi:hypothetical protein